MNLKININKSEFFLVEVFSGPSCLKETEHMHKLYPPFIECLAHMIHKVSGTLDSFV